MVSRSTQRAQVWSFLGALRIARHLRPPVRAQALVRPSAADTRKDGGKLPPSFSAGTLRGYGLTGVLLLLLSVAMIAIAPPTISRPRRMPNVPMPAKCSECAAGEAVRACTALGVATAAVEPKTSPALATPTSNFLKIICLPFQLVETLAA